MKVSLIEKAKVFIWDLINPTEKISKHFDLKKNMWKESYIFLKYFELIIYKVAKGYPTKKISGNYKI